MIRDGSPVAGRRLQKIQEAVGFRPTVDGFVPRTWDVKLGTALEAAVLQSQDMICRHAEKTCARPYITNRKHHILHPNPYAPLGFTLKSLPGNS